MGGSDAGDFDDVDQGSLSTIPAASGWQRGGATGAAGGDCRLMSGSAGVCQRQCGQFDSQLELHGDGVARLHGIVSVVGGDVFPWPGCASGWYCCSAAGPAGQCGLEAAFSEWPGPFVSRIVGQFAGVGRAELAGA